MNSKTSGQPAGWSENFRPANKSVEMDLSDKPLRLGVRLRRYACQGRPCE
jgi:hypothetical protein